MTSLKFVDVPTRSDDPIVRAREALIARLAEQVALSRDPQLKREKRKGKGESRTTVQLPISPWFAQRLDGTVILTVKVGGKKCTAIEIPSMELFESHLAALMQAVHEGKLDQYLGKKLIAKKPAQGHPARGVRRAA